MITLSSFLSTGFFERCLIILQKDASKLQHVAKESSKLNSIFLPLKKEILGCPFEGTLSYVTLDLGYQNFGVQVKI